MKLQGMERGGGRREDPVILFKTVAAVLHPASFGSPPRSRTRAETRQWWSPHTLRNAPIAPCPATLPGAA
jgi:hypothetical protein